jgi:hypothetical protein
VHRPPKKVEEPKELIPVEVPALRREEIPNPSDMGPKFLRWPKIKREKPSYPEAPVAQAGQYSGTTATGSRFCNSS